MFLTFFELSLCNSFLIPSLLCSLSCATCSKFILGFLYFEHSLFLGSTPRWRAGSASTLAMGNPSSQAFLLPSIGRIDFSLYPMTNLKESTVYGGNPTSPPIGMTKFSLLMKKTIKSWAAWRFLLNRICYMSRTVWCRAELGELPWWIFLEHLLFILISFICH